MTEQITSSAYNTSKSQHREKSRQAVSVALVAGFQIKDIILWISSCTSFSLSLPLNVFSCKARD